jgi:hypothetical protein
MKIKLNNISAFQFYQLARYTTLIAIGIIFAKSSLSQQAIGEYETFVFVAGAVSFFWLNGLLKAMLPLSVGRHSESTIFSSFITISIFSLLTVLLLKLMLPFVSGVLLDGKEIPEQGSLFLFLTFGVPAGIIEYVYLIKGKNRSLIFYSIVSFAVQFLLVAMPVILGYSVEWSLRGLAASAVLKFLWLVYILVLFSETKFSISFVKAHLKLGTPLVVAAFLSGSAQFVDGFIVTSRYDESTFAVFRYGARELPLAILLANALSSAMLPVFANRDMLKENLQKLKDSTSRLVHFLFPVTALLLLVSHVLFPVLFNPAFKDSATIFNIYLLLIISRLILPQTILNGLMQTRHIMAASFFELSLNVGLSLLFVNIWGINGIAFATFIAYLFEKIYLVAVVRIKLGIPLSSYHPMKYYLYYSAGIIVIFIFAEIIFR